MIQTGGLMAKEQKWGDCFAHASTILIMKLLKKIGIVPDVRDLTEKDEQYKADLNLLDSLEQQYIDSAIESAYASSQRMKVDAEYETIQYLIDNEIKRIKLLIYNYDLTNPQNQRYFSFEKLKLEEINKEISFEKSNLDRLAGDKSNPDYQRQEEIVNKLIKTSEYMAEGLKILDDKPYDDIDKREEFYKTIKNTFAKMTKIVDNNGLQEFRQMKTKMLDDAKKLASDEIQRLNGLIAEYEKKLKMDEDDKKKLEEMKLELERQTSESKQLDIETKIHNDKIDAEETSKIEIDGLKKKIDAIESGEDQQKIELLNELRTSLQEELKSVSELESSTEKSRVRARDLNEIVQYLETKINAIDTKTQDLALIHEQDKTPELQSYDDAEPHKISTDFITTTTITPPISQKNTDEIEDTLSQVLTKDQTQDPKSNDSTIITPRSNSEGLNIEEQRQIPLQGMTQDPQSVDKEVKNPQTADEKEALGYSDQNQGILVNKDVEGVTPGAKNGEPSKPLVPLTTDQSNEIIGIINNLKELQNEVRVNEAIVAKAVTPEAKQESLDKLEKTTQNLETELNESNEWLKANEIEIIDETPPTNIDERSSSMIDILTDTLQENKQQSPSTPNIISPAVPPQQTMKTPEVEKDQNSIPNQQSQVKNEQQMNESSNVPSQDTTSTQQLPSTPNIPSQTVPSQQILKPEEVKTDQNSTPNQQSQVENKTQMDESPNVPSSNNIPSIAAIDEPSTIDTPPTNLKQDLQDEAKTTIDAIDEIKRAKDELALSQSIETKAITPEAIAISKQDVQDKQETLAKSMNKGSELINQNLNATENIDDLYIKLIQSLIDYLIRLLKKHETFDNLQKSQSSSTLQSGGITPEEISRRREETRQKSIAAKAEMERKNELDTQKLAQIREDAENKAKLDVLKRFHEDEIEKQKFEKVNKEIAAKEKLNAVLLKRKKAEAELKGIKTDNKKWLSFLIDTSKLFFDNLDTRSKFREGKFNDIEEDRRKIVGEINDDGVIVKEGRNKQLSEIIATQTLYYRQIHLYIVQTCGINGGSQGVIFGWLCVYVNTGKKSLDELCEKTRPDCINDVCEYNQNFDEDVKRLRNDIFFTQNVVEKIRSVLQSQKKKLQLVSMYRNEDFYTVTIDKYNMEKQNEISNRTVLDLAKISDRNIYLRNAQKIIQKGLYVSLGIKVNDEFNKELYDFDTPEYRPIDHAVTITNITDELITIKNSWGITFGEFGKIYVPFMKFDNRFRQFDIEYIDIVDDVKKRGGNRLLRKTRKKNRKSIVSVKKRKTRKSI